MATVYTREWIQFFTGCGIPEDIAAMYALIFYENRIQKNMLLDLNKEYLRDMGITVMGDVIAILRHAKIIHEKYVRAQILSVDDNTIIKQSNSINESSQDGKKSTPMKRMLEHYTRKYNSQEIEPVNGVQVTVSNDKVLVKQGDNIGVERLMKRKLPTKTKEKDLGEKSPEVPVPKVRRVLRENEGGYKIKMPSGTTERSKKLLEQAKKRKSQTVFDRLGESSVSSTTSEITINTSASTSTCKEKNTSVFSRLGEKASIVSSTSSAEEMDSSDQLPDQLQYAGVLKGSFQKKISSSTMRADEQEQSVVSKESKVCSVKKRLGISSSEAGTQQHRLLFKKMRLIGEAEDAGPILKIAKNFTSVKPRITSDVKSEAEEISAVGSKDKTKIFNLKQRLSAALEIGPFKKVRFGRTSHRLIPGTPSQESDNYLKNYPKLTMTINNRERDEDVSRPPSGTKLGSLNSDSLTDRIGIKSRIGYQQLLKKPACIKKSSVKDRLG